MLQVLTKSKFPVPMEGSISDENGAVATEFKLFCVCKGILVVSKPPTRFKQCVFSQKIQKKVTKLFGKCEL